MIETAKRLFKMSPSMMVLALAFLVTTISLKASEVPIRILMLQNANGDGDGEADPNRVPKAIHPMIRMIKTKTDLRQDWTKMIHARPVLDLAKARTGQKRLIRTRMNLTPKQSKAATIPKWTKSVPNADVRVVVEGAKTIGTVKTSKSRNVLVFRLGTKPFCR